MIYTGLNGSGEVEAVYAAKRVTTIGTPPLSYPSKGYDLEDFLISGNTVQNSTPTPEAPVDVVGCGVRTGNLWNYMIVQGGWSASSGTIPTPYGPDSNNYTNRCRVPYMIPVPSNTLSLTCPRGIKINFVWIDANGVSLGGSGWQQSSNTVTAPKNADTMTFILAKVDESNCSPDDFQNIMLNAGTEPLPYEPYGYKLPLTVNGTEHPIYLGNVQTTRRIRKLVLTGAESDWRSDGEGSTRLYNHTIGTGVSYSSEALCNVAEYSDSVTTSSRVAFDIVAYQGSLVIRFHAIDYTTLSDFKSYLAAQYAAGTPVTVWYVLAEPETAITNEPLHKISTYADTISLSQSGITVPTTAGTNTITTETTVLPSSISVTTPEKEIAEVYSGINYQNPVYYKTRTLTGTSPLTFKGLGQPLKDYLISGNTVQDGTPTPEAPVDVVGCGVRTGNLFDYQTMGGTIEGYYLDIYGELQPSSLAAVTDYIPCSGGSFALDKIGGISPSICLYDENKQFLYGKAYNTPSGSDKQTIIVDTSFNASFIRFSYFYTGAPRDDLSAIMLNAGSTPLPYEPYGYKLPLTVNNTEYPIYLGQVQTTRRIRKLVLTGEEVWVLHNGNYFSDVTDGNSLQNTPCRCTHTVEGIIISDGSMRLKVFASQFTTVASNLEEWKNYLAAQYAAGTPVTVWYVLATPETSITNEPLHKIGDYADTVSFAQAGVTIPTVAGTNTLTVDTTVLPSAVSITGNIKLI